MTKTANEKTKVECLECGRKFAVSPINPDPRCTCGSVDLDVCELPIGIPYGSLDRS
jgi:hypothetical protein